MRFRSSQCRKRVVELEFGQAAALGQPLCGLRLGLALQQQLPRGFDHRFLAFGFELENQVACFDPAALLHRQFGNNAAGTRGQNGFLVGLGGARKADGARMHDARRIDHGDRAQDNLLLFRLGLRCFRCVFIRGAADGRKLAGRDPCGSGCEDDNSRHLVKLYLWHVYVQLTDPGGDAAHAAPSPIWVGSTLCSIPARECRPERERFYYIFALHKRRMAASTAKK